MANKDVNQSSALILDPALCVFKPIDVYFILMGWLNCVCLFSKAYHTIGLALWWTPLILMESLTTQNAVLGPWFCQST